jgi:hypothetical protein
MTKQFTESRRFKRSRAVAGELDLIAGKYWRWYLPRPEARRYRKPFLEAQVDVRDARGVTAAWLHRAAGELTALTAEVARIEAAQASAAVIVE